MISERSLASFFLFTYLHNYFFPLGGGGVLIVFLFRSVLFFSFLFFVIGMGATIGCHCVLVAILLKVFNIVITTTTIVIIVIMTTTMIIVIVIVTMMIIILILIIILVLVVIYYYYNAYYLSLPIFH